MRIISVPKPNPEYKSTCGDCGTKVALLPTDTTFISDKRDGDAISWDCPTCNQVNWISVTILPKPFYRLVLEKKTALT